MLTSKANPLIKQARALRQSKGRTETGLFLIEGLQQVGAAVDSGWGVEFVLYSQDVLRSEFGRTLIASFEGRIAEVSSEVLASVADKEHPQGILAAAKQRHRSLTSMRPGGFAAALVRPQDPGNLGSILRTLDAAGGSTLYLLDGGVDPYHPTAIRASMGAAFTIPVVEASFDEFGEWCRTQTIQLIGASAKAARDFREARPRQPWILVLGSEQKGLSEDQKRACDILVSLPMRGGATSLNLAVAAGILLYAYAG